MNASVSRRGFLAGATALGALSAIHPAFAANFPEKDFNWLVPYAPGGMSDNLSRLIGQQITATTGRQVINDYKPGAGGAIGANAYLATPKDGYSLLQATNSFFGVIPHVTKLTFDPMAELTPLALIGDAPMVMAVNPSVEAQTLTELIAYAKANPGKLAYATAGKGTVGHLCGEWLQRAAGIELLHIPYSGAAPGFQAALSGEAQIVFGPEAAEYVDAGSLRGIAIIGQQRWERLPDLPVVGEVGLTGWTPRSWHTVVTHAATPEETKQALNKLINDALSSPDVIAKIKLFGLIPSIETIEQVQQRAVDDNTQFGQLITEIGLAVQ